MPPTKAPETPVSETNWEQFEDLIARAQETVKDSYAACQTLASALKDVDDGAILRNVQSAVKAQERATVALSSAKAVNDLRTTDN